MADVGFLADDQAQRTEVGKAPELGEPDAEVLAPGRGRRALEQVRDRRGGRPAVLGVEAGGIQAGVAHHRGWVEAEGSGELDEVVQAPVAGQWGRRHDSVRPEMNGNVSRKDKSGDRLARTVVSNTAWLAGSDRWSAVGHRAPGEGGVTTTVRVSHWRAAPAARAPIDRGLARPQSTISWIGACVRI
jgi:hypothetical protein